MKEIIIVLGGGLSKNGDLTNKVKKRVKLAYDLIDEADAIIFSSKYTLNIPQKTDINGFVLFEASAMAKYFLKLGPVSSCSIFLELSSTDTIGSALFTRQQLESMGFYPRNITIITANWHLQRAHNIFEWAYSLRGHYETNWRIRSEGSESKTTPTRILKEKAALEAFKRNWEPIQDLRDAWQKLYMEHSNYNSQVASNYKLTGNHGY